MTQTCRVLKTAGVISQIGGLGRLHSLIAASRVVRMTSMTLKVPAMLARTARSRRPVSLS